MAGYFQRKEGKVKISKLVAALAWISLIALSWCILLGAVASNFKTWSFWVFFFGMGLLASSAIFYQRKP
jgi:hypothetical protein